MKNLLSETRLSLSKLAQEEKVSPSTPWRWTKSGVRGCQLESFSVGARRFTTREAFSRFVEATTAAAATGPMPSVRTPRQLERTVAAAEREPERGVSPR